jgi:hypothetical protein
MGIESYMPRKFEFFHRTSGSSMAPPRGPTGIPPPRVQQAVRAARQGAWNISYETERKSVSIVSFFILACH